MKNEKRKGIINKLAEMLKSKPSCCCNMRIEEVAEDAKEGDISTSTDSSDSPCCAKPPKAKDSK